ncbi:hypothetical protein [Falsiroseomonas sp.]|uniref:hypothetical protein n=1 Tax=Falsiroseomonas sp. TaxID=2870721 RepID=UPI003F6F67DB
MLAETPEPSLRDLLVARHERVTEGIRYLHVPNPANTQKRLIVTFATHNNNGRYAAIDSIHRKMPMDLLAFCDPDNSYYLYDDGGARFGALLRELIRPYAARRVLFFGSSMAGYAALRWAIELEAACVVSNPQVNLDASVPHAWRPLRDNILRIPQRVNLDELPAQPRRAALTVLHGRHPLDLENMRRLFSLWLASPGMSLNIRQVDETQHAYLIRDFRHFTQLVEQTYEQRAALEVPVLKPSA